MKNDDLGNRMKELEGMESDRRCLPFLPVLARLDGKCFHSFTQGLNRPYDIRLSDMMKWTTRYLVEETNALLGYTQSDEISLMWYSDNYKSQIYFDGRIQKMVSDLAAMTSVYFNHILPQFLPEKVLDFPRFDCRVWQVPTKNEAVNTFGWRELDATKNSISMAARCYFSHKELMNKSGKEMQEMLFEKEINWNDYPDFFKRGTYFQRKKIKRKFTVEELKNLPEKHEARKNPDLKVVRTEIKELNLPKLFSIQNRVDVVFDEKDPIVE